jgi:hypothetical protein
MKAVVDHDGNLVEGEDGGLLFNDLSPDDARQRTLDEPETESQPQENAKRHGPRKVS